MVFNVVIRNVDMYQFEMQQQKKYGPRLVEGGDGVVGAFNHQLARHVLILDGGC